MPKHYTSFKHLISTSQSGSQHREQRTRSVNELLSSSRHANPSSLHVDYSSGIGSRDLQQLWRTDQVWTPGVDSVVEMGNGGVHAAELMRRVQVARAIAQRSVAGPVAPLSWRQPVPHLEHAKVGDNVTARPLCEVTPADLLGGSALFTYPDPPHYPWPKNGAPSLVTICLNMILGLGHGTEVIDGAEQNGQHPQTLGDAVLETMCDLDISLRGTLIRTASLLPPGDPLRLTDNQLRILLEYEPAPLSRRGADVEDACDTSSSSADWDNESTTVLSHLPLTAHASPLRFLRDLPYLHGVALTSLDLSYSTLPVDLERVVNVLPTSLRALGICGVRIADTRERDSRGRFLATADYQQWERGFAQLGKAMIVLQTLDLAEFAQPSVLPLLLTALLGGEKLPSLRLLGLRGSLGESDRDLEQIGGRDMAGVGAGTGAVAGASGSVQFGQVGVVSGGVRPGSEALSESIGHLVPTTTTTTSTTTATMATTVTTTTTPQPRAARREILDLVRRGRKRWVEVVF